MKHLAVLLIVFYRKFLSPLKGKSTCRFYPTCSQYAIRVYRDFGFIRGSAYTVWRILRCQPFCRGGFDPPPPKKRAPDRISRSSIYARTLPFLPDIAAGATTNSPT